MPKKLKTQMAPTSPKEHRFWLGVVGRRDSHERLLGGDLWWCVAPTARVGDQVAMYLTQAVSAKDSGVFGVYEITALDTARASECKGFGSSITGLFNVFAHIRLIQKVTPALSLSNIRADPILRHTKFVRRNGQGTLFDITSSEFTRLIALCRVQPRRDSKNGAAALPKAALSARRRST